MNKDKMRLLKDAKIYPAPEAKGAFLRKYRKRVGAVHYTGWDMIRSQIGYIQRHVWIISFAALAVAVIGLSRDEGVIFAAAAMMPFVSGIAVLESFRAERYGLSEMEGVTLFSRRGILFARIVCVGTVHLALLLLLTILIGSKEGYGLAMTGSILTVPYLLSSIINMELERTEFGRKSALPGLGVVAIMAVAVLVVKEEEVVFLHDYYIFWYLLTAVLIVMELMEIRKTFHMDTDFVIER